MTLQKRKTQKKLQNNEMKLKYKEKKEDELAFKKEKHQGC
jgi:hypothetical protein